MTVIKRIISFILSPLHVLVYGILLVLFHGLQWIALKLGGRPWQKIVADYLNFFLIKSLCLVGIGTKFINKYDLPSDRPLIIVANHQSHYDISPMSWYLRKHSVKYIAKTELKTGVPSVSFNLRHGGSVFVDLDNPRETLKQIKKIGSYIEANNFAAVIFPEGQRNYDGVPSEFFKNGIKMLIKFAPNALIVPITINNSWKILSRGYFQLPIGITTSWKVQQPLEPKAYKFADLMQKIETEITKDILIES